MRVNLSDLSNCTIQLRDGTPCGQPSAPHMPFPICGAHGAELYRHVAKMLGGLAEDPGFRAAYAMDVLDRDRQKVADRNAQRDHHVYYVQIGDLIKIGYTSTLKQRMASYPPGRRLLATELGDVRLERKRHGQFKELLAAANEWFHPGAELIDHINELRQRAGQEPVTL